MPENRSVDFLISVLMPQFRNERANGNRFPPFRSSVVKNKKCARAFNLLLIAYALLLEVFLYRGYGVVDQELVMDSIEKNKKLFLTIFGKELKK
jgi:hypothetical protein